MDKLYLYKYNRDLRDSDRKILRNKGELIVTLVRQKFPESRLLGEIKMGPDTKRLIEVLNVLDAEDAQSKFLKRLGKFVDICASLDRKDRKK